MRGGVETAVQIEHKVGAARVLQQPQPQAVEFAASDSGGSSAVPAVGARVTRRNAARMMELQHAPCKSRSHSLRHVGAAATLRNQRFNVDLASQVNEASVEVLACTGCYKKQVAEGPPRVPVPRWKRPR